MNKTVLVLSPHCDDAEIGCGGYIARTVAEGGTAIIALMTVSTVEFLHRGLVSINDRLHEFRNSCSILGVKETHILTRHLDGKMYTHPQSEMVALLDNLLNSVKPDEVLIPLPSSHQDHRYCWEVGIAATRPSASKHNPRMIAAYEYPVSCWGDGASANAGKGGVYVNISSYWEKKKEALMCYETQMRGPGHLISIQGCEALANLRGIESGFEKAELFHALRIRE
jgi:LmbE family N-acetylglucosaminyl deacetylase